MTRPDSRIRSRLLCLLVILLCPLLMAPECGGDGDSNGDGDDGQSLCLNPGGCASARISLHLKWSAAAGALIDDVQQLAVMISDIPTGQLACASLRSTDPDYNPQSWVLFPFPDVLASGGTIGLPPVSGEFSLFVLALAEGVDWLCRSDYDCASSERGEYCQPLPSGIMACSDVNTTLAAIPLAIGCSAVTLDTAGGAENDWTVDLDTCGEQFCDEHGACSETAMELTCDCAEGYAGETCDECATGYTGYPDCQPE